MNEVLETLVKFNKDRLLNEQNFDLQIGCTNILEEVLEAHGVKDTKDRVYAKQVYEYVKNLAGQVKEHDPENYKEPTETDIVDAFCDMQVYAFGEPFKMGFNPILCLDETAQEISSRAGKIIDGKFVKDKSPEAQALWKVANFESCRLNED